MVEHKVKDIFIADISDLKNFFKIPYVTRSRLARFKESIKRAGDANRYSRDSDTDSLPDPELYEPEV